MSGFLSRRLSMGLNNPYFVCRKDPKIFAIASLWDMWESPSAEIIYSCCMITTPLNEFLAQFHNRMPAILDIEEQKVMVNAKNNDLKELKKHFETVS